MMSDNTITFSVSAIYDLDLGHKCVYFYGALILARSIHGSEPGTQSFRMLGLMRPPAGLWLRFLGLHTPRVAVYANLFTHFFLISH